MSKQVTRWSPDTCGCVVEYVWDDTHFKVLSMKADGYGPDQIAAQLGMTATQVIKLSHQEETREHTLHHVVTKCARHASMSDAEVYARVAEENPRKNRVRALILESVPAVAAARIQENGEAAIDFHPNKPFAYEFDAEHVLHVTVSGMTAASRKKVQKLADAAHGRAKVVIH